MALLTQNCIDKIKTANVIIQVVELYQQTENKRDGKDFKTTSEPKLILNTNKVTAFDYKNTQKGFLPISYLMEFQNKTYFEALQIVAETANIVLEYEKEEKPSKPKRQKPQERKQNLKSYRDATLAESGLVDADQKITVIRTVNGKEVEQEIDIYTSGAVLNYDFAKPTHGDDLIIRYVDLNRKEVQVTKVNRTGAAIGKKFPFIRVRHQNPNLHKDRNDKPKKYESPAGSGAKLYLPAALINAYQSARVIDTLYIQEGEKKADKATKHGLFSVGIGGITSIANKGVLPHEFESIIKTCSVKNVVFVVDADFKDIGNSSNEPVDRRPNSFFNAVKNYRQYFYEFINTEIYLNIFFGYINNPETKGIDDLLVKHEKDVKKVVKNIKETLKTKSGQGDFLNLYNITTHSDSKIQEYFKLHDRESFFKAHFEELKNRVHFKYRNQKFRYAEETETFELDQPMLAHEVFYTKQVREVKGKEIASYGLDFEGLNIFLQNRGFNRYKGSKETIHVNVGTDRIITQVTEEEIKDYVIDFTRENISGRDILNMLFSNQAKYLGANALSNLKFAEPPLHSNSKTQQFFFFQNNFIEISPTGIDVIDYNQLAGYVWHENILNRKFTLLEPLFYVQNVKTPEDFEFVIEDEAFNCEFFTFLYKTSNFYHRKASLNEDEEAETQKHLLNKLTGLGYLLHTYFDPTNAKAVFAIDGKDSAMGESHGRTGKSLLGEAVAEIIPTARINGKSFDPAKFPWENVSERTPFVFFDDPRANLDFETFYPLITGNFEVEQKGKGKITIPRELTPKFLFPTNHPLKDNSSSTKDRTFFMSYSDYYSETRKPSDKDEYNHQFFYEWSNEQYNMFLNLAFRSVQLYLAVGLQKLPNNELHLRTLRHQISDSFIDWADEYFTIEVELDPLSRQKSARLGHKLERIELMDHWAEHVEKTTKSRSKNYHGSPQLFGKRIRLYATFKGFIFNPGIPQRDGKGLVIQQHGGRHMSNGIEYYTLDNPVEL